MVKPGRKAHGRSLRSSGRAGVADALCVVGDDGLSLPFKGRVGEGMGSKRSRDVSNPSPPLPPPLEGEGKRTARAGARN